ncbi:MAG: nucleotidyl transferase AbiEii/AbiGii toxin family protein [Lewinellaceae bacterium]|nr:nucleotidyl transferase AbiEii/AbiGii toxin family protein [Lewinellaceae bacterium]
MLAKGHTSPPERKTKDVDLAVMVGSLDEYEQLKEAISALPDFEQDEKLPYRFIFQKAYELDFLPFGEIANEKGQVELLGKNAFTLDMPGLDLVQPFAETIETEEGLTLNVSSLSGIVLLKLLAWQDDPGREKDIHDIAYILKTSCRCIGRKSPRKIYWTSMQTKKNLFEQLVSARYVGRQMGIMLQNTDLKKRVQQLLEEESKKSSMARLMPQEYVEDSQRIITALLVGMNDTTSKE